MSKKLNVATKSQSSRPDPRFPWVGFNHFTSILLPLQKYKSAQINRSPVKLAVACLCQFTMRMGVVYSCHNWNWEIDWTKPQQRYLDWVHSTCRSEHRFEPCDSLDCNTQVLEFVSKNRADLEPERPRPPELYFSGGVLRGNTTNSNNISACRRIAPVIGAVWSWTNKRM